MAAAIIILSLVIGIVGIGYLYLNFKDRRAVDATVHIQERTEEAETLDFAIMFFRDETELQRKQKLLRYTEVAEWRRGENNRRLMEETLKRQQEIEKIKAERAAEGK